MNAQKPGAAAATPEFNEVFSENCPFAWRVLARLGVQQRDVPDACQEVFLVVHRRLGELDLSRGSLRSWLYGICVRVASDYRRRHPNRREAPEDELAAATSDPEQLAELERGRAWAQLAQVLEQMGPEKSDVFVLYELEGLPMNEIARAVGCPAPTAYARLYAARRLVQAAFGEEETP